MITTQSIRGTAQIRTTCLLYGNRKIPILSGVQQQQYNSPYPISGAFVMFPDLAYMSRTQVFGWIPCADTIDSNKGRTSLAPEGRGRHCWIFVPSRNRAFARIALREVGVRLQSTARPSASCCGLFDRSANKHITGSNGGAETISLLKK